MTNPSPLFDDIKAAERFPFARYAATLSERGRNSFAARAYRSGLTRGEVERLAHQAALRVQLD